MDTTDANALAVARAPQTIDDPVTPQVPSQPTHPPVDIITPASDRAVPPRSGQTIAAVERALDVLLLFGEDGHDDLGVTEVASLLHMSKAAVHRVLSSLRSRGLVTLDPATHRYSLGASALALGRAFLDRLDIRSLALGEMHDLSELTGETVLLSVRSINHLMFVEQAMPDREVRLEAPIGHPIRLHMGSTGSVFLAGLHPDDLADFLEHNAADPGSTLATDDVPELLVELALVAERGWAFSDTERQVGTASYSVPILDHRNDTKAVLTVGGPADRIREHHDLIVEALVAAGLRLSGRMGWTPPSDDEVDPLA